MNIFSSHLHSNYDCDLGEKSKEYKEYISLFLRISLENLKLSLHSLSPTLTLSHSFSHSLCQSPHQEFDQRPGLKFLLQKVACLDVAANMYKTAATAILFHVHTLLEICAHLEDSSIDQTK